MSTLIKIEQAASDHAAAFAAVLPSYVSARPAFAPQGVGGSVEFCIGGNDLAARATAAGNGIATRPAQTITVDRDRMSATGLNRKTNGMGHRPRELPL